MKKNNAIDIDIETGGGNTYTFPSATSTLATLGLAETLTNKDLSDTSNTLGSENVRSAGALMDDEVANLQEIKDFDSSDYANAVETTNALNDRVKSVTVSEPNGSDKVVNIVSLTQAEYDAGTPVDDTFYIIT
jgi:hypothetical protein